MISTITKGSHVPVPPPPGVTPRTSFPHLNGADGNTSNQLAYVSRNIPIHTPHKRSNTFGNMALIRKPMNSNDGHQ